MTQRKPKPVYSVTAYDDANATAVYSCLKTLCEAWGVASHYTTIWRWLNTHEAPYEDSKITIKKHFLIRSDYNRRTK